MHGTTSSPAAQTPTPVERAVFQASLSCGDGEALVDYDPTAGTSIILLGPTVNGGGVVDALSYPGYE